MIKCIILAILSFLYTIGLFGQSKQELLDSLFSTMHSREQFFGNVLIAEKGEIIYTANFGYTNRENKSVLNDTTLFNIGSVSKAFTALAIQQLEEKNLLSFSDSVVSYLPDFPYPAITIHHLLIHASGLPLDFASGSDANQEEIITNKDVLKLLYAEKPTLLFIPGSYSNYSNLGYIILAEVAESVSDQPFKEYLRENIFEEAGMKHTGLYDAEEIDKINNVARGYFFSPFSGKYEEAIKTPQYSHYRISGLQGEGNIYSNIIDLYRFYLALNNGTLISNENLQRGFEKRIEARMGDTPSFGNSYAFGWTALNVPMQVVNRGGELPGYAANILWNISDNRISIYLMNDYLAMTSYQRIFPMTIGRILAFNELELPKLSASVELTKIVLTCSPDELQNKITQIKEHPEMYNIDPPGLQYTILKLQELQLTDKAELIRNAFKPE